MGDGKEYTAKEQVLRELSKHGKLALTMSIKVATIFLYSLFMKTSFAQGHPVIVKIVTGAIVTTIITWIISYIRKLIKISRGK